MTNLLIALAGLLILALALAPIIGAWLRSRQPEAPKTCGQCRHLVPYLRADSVELAGFSVTLTLYPFVIQCLRRRQKTNDETDNLCATPRINQ